MVYFLAKPIKMYKKIEQPFCLDAFLAKRFVKGNPLV